MKNVICPISNEKVAEHLPRVTAFYNILLMSLFLFEQNIFILLLVGIDFLLRGFGYQQYSLLHNLSFTTSKLFKLNSPRIDKAPKQFAARLGGVMFIVAASLFLIGATSASFVIVSMVIILAALEGLFAFCVGCYIYTYLIFPFYNSNSLYTKFK